MGIPWRPGILNDHNAGKHEVPEPRYFFRFFSKDHNG